MKTKEKNHKYAPKSTSDYVDKLLEGSHQPESPPFLSVTDLALIGAIILFFIISTILWIKFPSSISSKESIVDNPATSISEDIKKQMRELTAESFVEVEETDPDFIDNIDQGENKNDLDPLAFDRNNQPGNKQFLDEINHPDSTHHTPSKFEPAIEKTTP